MAGPQFAAEVAEYVEGHLDWLRDLYRHFHSHPELSMAEHATADRIEQELTALGLEPKRIGGTGVVAVISNPAHAGAGTSGEVPTVLARADIDALPLQEDTDLEYASETPGVMHACGHDAHAAALLGATRILAENRDAWSGTYIAVFQPGEETAAGARAMVDDGLLERVPQPDLALSQHVMPTAAGTIGTVAGPVLSAGDSLKITIHGRGAHGSMPHTAVDPVVLASSIVLRLQTVVSREVEPGEFAVLTVGSLAAGAKANIIPDSAELLLNIRTYDPAVREQLISAIERIVRGECAAAGAPADPEFDYYDQYPLTRNDPGVTNTVTAAFVEHFGPRAVYEASRVTASEDFSLVPDAFGVPYTYWTVGSVDPARYRDAVSRGAVSQEIPANHSPHFAPEEESTLLTATRAQVVAALAYLGAERGSV
ncbi:amidohydrolase [Dietzia sp. HMSC21D01]|uniref:Amidohydrolase n=3 Tax=Dietzia cinnamea TaxID=321318 RepID=A0AAW5QDF6_9ACTN|nr:MULTISPECIES: amidohydrolase [Dietzia]MCT1865532.1 amidohydrolase [Dietzia cinnamea]MCT1885616.1 amidohydrolase [Dietzia cinnamea]MCT2030238.1 amidohydrolase [Dietzia cinnamea]MCT2033677.1 amidohydrolase [Dietzia cinnamea]MCT2077638.1 amidohydrolase [Dietzia cinnamea]